MATEGRIGTREAFARIRASLDALDHDRSSLAHEERLELVREARVVARRVTALEAMLVGEADAAGSSDIARGTPTTSWLMTDPTVTRSEAVGAVFAGADLSASAAVRGAALAGDLSLRQARLASKAIRAVPEGLSVEQRELVEADLVAHAPKIDERRIDAAVQAALERVAPEAAPGPEEELARLDAQRRRAYARRHLRLLDDGDGGVDLRGNLPALAAAPLRAVIDALVESDRRHRRDAVDRTDLREIRTPEQRRADALIILAARAAGNLAGTGSGGNAGPGRNAGSGNNAAAGKDPRAGRDARPDNQLISAAFADGVGPDSDAPGAGVRPVLAPTETAEGRSGERETGPWVPRVAGDRPRVVVTIREAELRARAEQAGILADGTVISAGELRRLCCDADLTPVVLGTGSVPLDVGREHRLVPHHLRKALSVRDGGCVFPRCGAGDARCEAHHIVPWWQGGRTSLDNLVLLCPHHHALVEPDRLFAENRGAPTKDRWEIRIDADGQPEVVPPRRVDPSRTPIKPQAA